MGVSYFRYVGRTSARCGAGGDGSARAVLPPHRFPGGGHDDRIDRPNGPPPAAGHRVTAPARGELHQARGGRRAARRWRPPRCRGSRPARPRPGRPTSARCWSCTGRGPRSAAGADRHGPRGAPQGLVGRVWEDVLPTGFGIYVGLEAEASSLRAFESLVLHGLLQTERYARAVLAQARRKLSAGGDRPAGDRADAAGRRPCGARWTRCSCG